MPSMSKLFNLSIAATSLIVAMYLSLLGYEYVTIGHGLHPIVAGILAFLYTAVTFHLVTVVLDQMIEEQTAKSKQLDREIKQILTHHEKLKASGYYDHIIK